MTLWTKITNLLSREDPNAYAEHVFGQRQHPIHELWQALLTEYPYLCIDAPVEHGKTTQVDAVRATWEIGKNPNVLITLISNSGLIPGRMMRIVRDTLCDNPLYHEVFPEVDVLKATGDEIFVRRPGMTLKDPTMSGVGIGGSIIGSRISILILDDFLDFQNTWSENERAKLWELLTSTVLNRVLKSGRVWDIGTPWHIEDARHKLRRLPGYVYAHFSAAEGLYFTLDGVRWRIPGGNPAGLWGEVLQDPTTGHEFGFPPERIALKRSQLPAREFARQFECKPLSGAMDIFSAEALEYSKSLGTALFFRPEQPWFKTDTFYKGRVTRTWRPIFNDDDVVVTGVDLAISKKETAHNTAMYTGTSRGSQRIVLEVLQGQMELTQIIQQMIRIRRTFRNHKRFVVENNGGQDYILQLTRNEAMMRALGATTSDMDGWTVVPWTTTAANKMDPLVGIRSLATLFEQGHWPIPADDRARCPGILQDWYDGLAGFDPTGHTADLVMASLFYNAAIKTVSSGGTLFARSGIFVG